jgi:hypothetical protein
MFAVDTGEGHVVLELLEGPEPALGDIVTDIPRTLGAQTVQIRGRETRVFVTAFDATRHNAKILVEKSGE